MAKISLHKMYNQTQQIDI